MVLKSFIFSAHYNWICFMSQQSAEKSIQALFYFLQGEKQPSHQIVALSKQVELVAAKKGLTGLKDLAGLANQMSQLGSGKGLERSDDLFDRSRLAAAYIFFTCKIKLNFQLFKEF